VSDSVVEGAGSVVVDVVGSSSVAWAARLLLECDRDGTSAVFESAKVPRKRGSECSSTHHPRASLHPWLLCLFAMMVLVVRTCDAASHLPHDVTRQACAAPSSSDHYRPPSYMNSTDHAPWLLSIHFPLEHTSSFCYI